MPKINHAFIFFTAFNTASRKCFTQSDYIYTLEVYEAGKNTLLRGNFKKKEENKIICMALSTE